MMKNLGRTNNNPRLMFVVPHIGDEVRYCGGLLSHLKDKFGQIGDKDKPRIIYGVVSDLEVNGRRVSIDSQFRMIREVSACLGFTFEVLYLGRSCYNRLHKQKHHQVKAKIKDRISFYKPDLLFCKYLDRSTLNNDDTQLFLPTRELAAESGLFNISFGATDTSNLLFGLSTNNFSVKRKMFLKYSALYGDKIVDLLSSFGAEAIRLGNRVDGVYYAEKYQIGEIDNKLLNIFL